MPSQFLGHSRNYRGAHKARKPFQQMPSAFQAVDKAWNMNAATVRETVAPHPPTEGAEWTYTLTYEFAVDAGGRQRTLRGHVHYTPDGLGYKAGPGYFWVQGVDNCDAQTPIAIVNRFADHNVEAEASGLAAIADAAAEGFFVTTKEKS
jgi:hypothetical protein